VWIYIVSMNNVYDRIKPMLQWIGSLVIPQEIPASMADPTSRNFTRHFASSGKYVWEAYEKASTVQASNSAKYALKSEKK